MAAEPSQVPFTSVQVNSFAPYSVDSSYVHWDHLHWGRSLPFLCLTSWSRFRFRHSGLPVAGSPGHIHRLRCLHWPPAAHKSSQLSLPHLHRYHLSLSRKTLLFRYSMTVTAGIGIICIGEQGFRSCARSHGPGSGSYTRGCLKLEIKVAFIASVPALATGCS